MLFSIEDKYSVGDFNADIEGDPNVIVYCDMPILFNGLNKFGEHIIANVCCEDEDNEEIRYSYFIVPTDLKNKFYNNEICYRQLVDSIGVAYIVDFNENEVPLRIYHVPISSIPEEYLSAYGLYYKNIS